jgi:predicted phosphodiesterase
MTPGPDLGRLQGPLLIFGGAYGNLLATCALQSLAEQLGIPPQNIICTGDMVAYCAEPEETVQLIRRWGIRAVMGNCEQSLAVRAVDCGCGFEEGSVCSALSVEWFRYADSRISSESRSWMGQLPQTLSFQMAGRRFAVVHGGVAQLNRFFFASTPLALKQAELDRLDDDIDGLIAGHCGIPFGQQVAGKVWLNAGVIGMPANDGTPDGWYLLLDQEGGLLQASWKRLNYPAQQARSAMLNAGLTGYADALTSGLWPSEDILPETEKMGRGVALNVAPLVF